MGADYTINCKCCGEELSSFYITRNYNQMFPFWLLHNENHLKEEDYSFMLKTVRKTLQYYMKGNIYNHRYWEHKSKYTPEHRELKGWETNKFTIICALIRYYWHLKRFPFNKYRWHCWF